MNREIKFRAWDKLQTKVQEDFPKTRWVYFTLKDLVTGKINLDDFENWDIVQYTGLKDKNSKEICEGDIVKFSPIGSSGTEITEVKKRGWYIEPFQRCFGRVEIIGNIYENKELLK